MRHMLLTAVPMLLAVPVSAQNMSDAGSSIQVIGSATILTPPDRATLFYVVDGEGRTADAASTALAVKNRAIGAALRSLLGADTEITASDVNITAVRAPECDVRGGYESRPRLS